MNLPGSTSIVVDFTLVVRCTPTDILRAIPVSVINTCYCCVSEYTGCLPQPWLNKHGLDEPIIADLDFVDFVDFASR